MGFKHQGNGQRKRNPDTNVLELLAIKLALSSFTKRRRVKVIDFQIDNNAVLTYLLKMEGT